MKVLLLGATGVSGRQAAALLNKEVLITEIGIASRRAEAAQKIAEEIGKKARAVAIDIQDGSGLASIASGYDILINAAGPTSEVQAPALQAAVAAGVHYCDLGVNGRPAVMALELDDQARAKGVTAVIGTGWCAVTGLMAVHAAGQLDQVEELTTCMQFDYSPGGFFSPEKFLARVREHGRVETSGIDLMEAAAGPVWTFQDGRSIRVEPMEHSRQVAHPSGYIFTAYPNDSIESVTLPLYLPEVKNIFSTIVLVPPPLNELYLLQGQRIVKGETDPAGAVVAFYEMALADKDRWLAMPPGCPAGWGMWVSALGEKDGRQARYFCWPSMFINWTSVPLAIVALRVLRGAISRRGVFSPEACLSLETFMEDAARYAPAERRGQPLLNERLIFPVP